MTSEDTLLKIEFHSKCHLLKCNGKWVDVALPFDMTLEEIAQKHDLKISYLKRMEQMFQIVVEMDYLSLDQKSQILTILMAAVDQKEPSDSQANCLSLSGSDCVQQMDTRLESAEFKAMVNAFGQPNAWERIAPNLQKVVGYETPVIDQAELIDMSQKVEEEWKNAQSQWAKAENAWQQVDQEAAGQKSEDPTSQQEKLDGGQLPHLDTANLPEDNWEVALLIHDPIDNSHNLTLLKTGIRDQRIIPEDYGTIKNGDIAKSAGALKRWGQANASNLKLEELSYGSHCPHLKDKAQWALSIASKHGDFDRVYLINIQLEHPNPSLRIESAETNEVKVTRKRRFEFQGLGAHCSVEGSILWPSSHLIQDEKDPSRSGWGIFSIHGDRRSISEKWQVRGGWKIGFKQLKGPSCDTALRVESGGSTTLNIVGHGNHHGEIKAHSAAFASIGKPGKGDIRLKSTKPPANLIWENTVDYHTEAVKIPREMDEIDLSQHSLSLQEKRRPTIGGTRPFNSETQGPLKGSVLLNKGTLVGHFVAETKLIHENSNKDQNCDFHGRSVSEWNGEIKMTLPLTPTDTIEFNFGKGTKASVKNSDSNNGHRTESIERLGIAHIRGPHFEWTLDQVSQTHTRGWSHRAKTINLSQQGWRRQLETKTRQGEVKMRVELGRTRTGFRLRNTGKRA